VGTQFAKQMFMTPQLWLAVFVVLQVADGLMTYAAVGVFGPQAEGNPLLLVWMGMLGYGPALVGAKALACGCGVILYVFGVNRVLASLTALYLFGAVMPWLQVLSSVRG
jgi:hypothetical protein